MDAPPVLVGPHGTRVQRAEPGEVSLAAGGPRIRLRQPGFVARAPVPWSLAAHLEVAGVPPGTDPDQAALLTFTQAVTLAARVDRAAGDRRQRWVDAQGRSYTWGIPAEAWWVRACPWASGPEWCLDVFTEALGRVPADGQAYRAWNNDDRNANGATKRGAYARRVVRAPAGAGGCGERRVLDVTARAHLRLALLPPPPRRPWWNPVGLPDEAFQAVRRRRMQQLGRQRRERDHRQFMDTLYRDAVFRQTFPTGIPTGP